MLLSCNNIFSSSDEDKHDKPKITFEFEDFYRSAMPDVQVENLTNFVLYSKTQTDLEYSQLKTWGSYKSIKNATVEISEGIYDFKMEAECSGMNYSAEITEKLINQGTNKLNFSFSLTGISLLSGEGSFEITLNYPLNQTVGVVTASLFTQDDIAVTNHQNESLNNTNGTATYSVSNIPGGIYHILFKLFYDSKCTTLLATCQETAIITDGITSYSTVEVTNLNDVYRITYVLNGLKWKDGFEPQTVFTRFNEIVLPGREALDIEDDAIFYGWYKMSA